MKDKNFKLNGILILTNLIQNQILNLIESYILIHSLFFKLHDNDFFLKYLNSNNIIFQNYPKTKDENGNPLMVR